MGSDLARFAVGGALVTARASTQEFPDATPRPWHQDEGFPLAICQADGSSLGAMEPGFPQISNAEMEANAALVCCAVNERDGLLAENKRLREALAGLLEQADLGAVDEETQPLVDAARAALGEA
jgi:hypothetical protein